MIMITCVNMADMSCSLIIWRGLCFVTIQLPSQYNYRLIHL